MDNRQPRLERAEEAVQAIIAAATAELLEHGVDSVTHRRIAERANVNLRSTTYYFKSVKALRREALKVSFSLAKKGRDSLLADLANKTKADLLDLFIYLTYGTVEFELNQLSVTQRNVSMASADPDYMDVMQQLQIDVELAVKQLFAHFNFDFPADRAIVLLDGRIFEYVLSGGKTNIKERLRADLGL
jgi:DNA-binding transcriptional regulator YbjK